MLTLELSDPQPGSAPLPSLENPSEDTRFWSPADADSNPNSSVTSYATLVKSLPLSELLGCTFLIWK